MTKAWSEGKFVHKKWTRVLLAITALAVMMPALAQVPKDAARRDPNQIYNFGKTMTRAEVIENRALDNRALNLTRTQSAEIDKFTDIYVEERRKLDEKYPLERGQMPKAEAILARDRALVNYTTAVTKLLSPEQIKIWKDGQAARRPPPPDKDRPFGLTPEKGRPSGLK